MARRQSIAGQAQERLAQSAAHAGAEVAATAAAPTAPSAPSTGAAYAEVPIEAVAPNRRNVRTDLGDLTELAASISEVGVLEPCVVRTLTAADRADGYPQEARYVLVMGERRWAASRQAQQPTLPVLVRPTIVASNERQLMLVENLQRQDLPALDEARAYQELVDEGMSQREIARQIGKTQAHISRRLGLLRLDPGIQNRLGRDQLGVDVAVNQVGRLPAETQAELAAELDAEDARHGTPRVWTGEAVRGVVDRVEQARHQRQVEAQNRAEAEQAGAEIVASEDELRERLGQDYYTHLLYHRTDIAAAGQAGQLLAVPTTSSSGPRYFTTAAPQKQATVDPEAAERKARREAHAALTRWVETARRPSKGDLTDLLARHTVAMMPRDEGALVHKWLRGRIGEDTGDFETWKASLADSDVEDCLRVAWLVTVAHDLLASRWAPHSPAAERTKARIGEVS